MQKEIGGGLFDLRGHPLEDVYRRAHNKRRRAILREQRHGMYRAEEKRKNRKALKKMGLSRNVNDPCWANHKNP